MVSLNWAEEYWTEDEAEWWSWTTTELSWGWTTTEAEQQLNWAEDEQQLNWAEWWRKPFFSISLEGCITIVDSYCF